jgi:hypothetical protein
MTLTFTNATSVAGNGAMKGKTVAIETDMLTKYNEHMQEVSARLQAAREASKEHTLRANSLRGNLVMAKAIAYALHYIDSLPSERQEWSDRQDMCNIMLHCLPESLVHMAVVSVEHHTQSVVDVTDHKTDKEG